MDDVIFTPYYKGTVYQYHECSECNYHVEIGENIFSRLEFGDAFKFCPNCGRPVARFAEIPKFLEEVDSVVFKKLDDIYNEYKDKLDYYCRITLTQNEFDEMIGKCKFAVALAKKDGGYVSPAVRAVAEMNSTKWSRWSIKKLVERVEKEEKVNEKQ